VIVLDTNVISEVEADDDAEVAGALLAARRRAGRPMTLADALIAGVCVTHECVLATRNVRDFADTPVSLVNPWDS
jgi:predicted nucleic acid-binding protein